MANMKNFGLSGVAQDVQLGKGGGRFAYDSANGIFKFTGNDGATLVPVRVAAPVNAFDAVTKEYADSLASGLDPKQSVRVATDGALSSGTYSPTGGPSGSGQFTGAPTTIDGVVLANGDRVLVKDQADQKQNGIYQVVSSGTWKRAEDQDGTPASEVSGGNFAFVESGTANSGSGWVVQGDGVIGLNVGNISWVKFSAAGSYLAGTGLSSANIGSGVQFNLDYTNLVDEVPSASYYVASFDGADMSKATWSDVFEAMDVVRFTGAATNGVLVRTGEDVYTTRTLTSGDGISITNADFVAGNAMVEVNFLGLDESTSVVGTDNLAFHGDFLNRITVDNFLKSQGVAFGLNTTSGYVSYNSVTKQSTARSFAASSTANRLGLSVVNGDGVAGPTEYGLNILGTAAISGGLAATDSFLVYDDSTSSNVKATIQDIANVISSISNDNQIVQGDSSIVVTDAGTGNIVVTVDGSEVATFTAGNLAADSVTVRNLVSGRVTFAGASGALMDDAGLTYNAATDALSVGSVIAVGDVAGATVHAANLTSGRVILAGAAGLLQDNANLTFNGSQLEVTGTLNVTSNATVGGSMTATAGVSGSTLTATGMSAGAGNVVYVGAGGLLKSEAAFAYNETTDTLTVTGAFQTDNIKIDGNTISTTDTNGNLILAPNGTGEVIIGSSGAGSITADAGQDLTLQGGDSSSAAAAGDVNIFGGNNSSTGAAGNVIIQAGSSTSGTDGDLIFKDADGNIILEMDQGGVNHIELKGSATGTYAKISADVVGSDTNAGLIMEVKGTGTVRVSTAGYENNLSNANDLVNKAYVDNLVSSNTTPGSVGSVSAVVNLGINGAVTIGSIPAGATVLRVYAKVTAAATGTTSITIGSVAAGAAGYAASTETDMQSAGVYLVEAFVDEASVTNATATVANATSGSVKIIIEYRNA